MRQFEDQPLRAIIRDNVISNVNTSTNVSTYGIAVSHNATGVLQVVVSGNQVLNNRQFGLLVQGSEVRSPAIWSPEMDRLASGYLPTLW